MKNKVLKEKLLKHPVLTTIIIIQFVIIGMLICETLIKPRTVLDLDLKNFSAQNGNVRFANDNLCFDEVKGDSKSDKTVNVSTDVMSIDSGAYEVSIQYDSYVAENRMDISNARVSLTSIVNIKCENITLSDAHTYESGKLWVPMFSKCNDLRLNIAYNGSGKLKIHGINIREILRYRFIRILKLILLFSAFDIFTVLFYTNINIKLKKEWVILFGIVVISSLPFFSSKLYKGDDIWFHLKRIATLAQEMQNGNFIIRMGTSLDNGYSYPTPIYYCDFFLYPVAFLYYMAVPLRVCYQIYVIFINTLTTIITYFSIGKFSRNTLIRLAGTALYVLSVYRLVNLNRRAAVGEYTAMTFLPLIVVGVYLIYNSKKPRINEWIYLALGMSGIILSHVLTCEIVVVNLIILCIVLLKRTLKKERIMAFIKAAIMCLVLTIWYLLPFIDYFVSQETIVQAGDLRLLDNSSQEIIDIFQLFAPGNEGWKCITLGAALILSLGITLYCLYKYSSKEGNEKAIFCIKIFSAFGIVNTLFICKFFPWGSIQQILGIDGLGYQVGSIQFSWRFMIIVVLMFVFASVISFDYLNYKNSELVRKCLIIILGCVVLSTGFYYYKHTDIAKTFTCNTVESYTNMDKLYLLSGTDDDIINRSCVNVVKGKAEISDYHKNKGDAYLTIKNDSTIDDAIVQVPIFNYKYYTVFDKNNKKLDLVGSVNNCVTFKVPPRYNRTLTIGFREPISWRISEIISAIGFIVALFIGIKLLVAKRRKNIR